MDAGARRSRHRAEGGRHPALGIDAVLRERIDRMLDDPPTAVLAFSDLAALEVMERARGRGLRVPEQLSIVGFDDNPSRPVSLRRSRPCVRTSMPRGGPPCGLCSG
ncbi:substrate-binding domain-containing protein [Microbacterium sp. Se5.02b]|nr:substrate-binding domain-containing protein [Microbacterium sp. Se5.02b]